MVEGLWFRHGRAVEVSMGNEKITLLTETFLMAPL